MDTQKNNEDVQSIFAESSSEEFTVATPASTTHRRKKKKNFVLVSSSDEEADTLKDHFWKDLEKGVLPQDLCSSDLYSSV